MASTHSETNAAPAPAFAPLAPLAPLIDACVHCGFCLPACPSYLLLGQEMDSPRGRIYLMKGGVSGRVELSDGVVQHFDTCLGCLACETACPSGVRYGPLIEETRSAIERAHTRPLRERVLRRLLFALLPYPQRLRRLRPAVAAAAALRRTPLVRLLPSTLRALMELSPAPEPGSARDVPAFTPAAGERRLRVGLLTGCVQRAFFGGVNRASVRVLAAEGCDVTAPPGQGCCGALALHAGQDDEARAFARRLIAAFEPADVDQVVVNAAGCGSAMKSYGHLLRGDPAWSARAQAFASKVRDISETLAALQPFRAPRQPRPMRVAYHDACHLAHAQGIRREPRQLLDSIPGVSVVPIAEADVCCGSAGIFNLVQPAMASALGRRKAAHIDATGADMVVTSNPGCLLQLQAAARAAGSQRPIRHIVEVLDEAIR
jgi:glycolate oxidase iron-sulfur subunit